MVFIAPVTDNEGPGKDSHTGLPLVPEGGVECLGHAFFYLSFNVIHAAPPATFVRSFQEFPPYAPASRPRDNVEVFDAGEVGAEGDAGPEGQDEDADHPAVRAGSEHLDVAGFDGASHLSGEVVRYGFAVPEPSF
jgi:hypothetical protein